MANDIAITLTSDTRKFSQGMKSARDDLSLFSSSIKAAGGLVAGFLSFQAVKAGFSTLSETVGKLDDLAAEAERLGVSTEFLSELQHAAQLSDTDIAALTGGLEKLEKNLGKATLEGGDLTKMLQRAGIDANDLAKLGPEKAFLKIADAVSRISDPLQRAAFITDVFGKSGQSLIGILSKGSEGINQLREEARRLGVSLSSDAAERIGLADDAMKRFNSAVEGLKTTFAVELAPALTSFVNLMTNSLVPALGRVAREFSLLKQNAEEAFHLLSNPRSLMNAQKAIDEFRLDRNRKLLLPKDGLGAANPNPQAKGGAGADIDLGGIKKDFKTFAKPLDVSSKEGFSQLARALTKPTGTTVADKQLREAQKANQHLGKIEAGLANFPKVAPAF